MFDNENLGSVHWQPSHGVLQLFRCSARARQGCILHKLDTNTSVSLYINTWNPLHAPHNYIRYGRLTDSDVILYLGITGSLVHSMLTGDRGFRLLQLEFTGHYMKYKSLPPFQQGGTLKYKSKQYSYSFILFHIELFQLNAFTPFFKHNAPVAQWLCL